MVRISGIAYETEMRLVVPGHDFPNAGWFDFGADGESGTEAFLSPTEWAYAPGSSSAANNVARGVSYECVCGRTRCLPTYRDDLR